MDEQPIMTLLKGIHTEKVALRLYETKKCYVVGVATIKGWKRQNFKQLSDALAAFDVLQQQLFTPGGH